MNEVITDVLRLPQLDIVKEYISDEIDNTTELLNSTIENKSNKAIITNPFVLSYNNWTDNQQTIDISLDTTKLNRVIPTASEVSKWADYGVYASSESSSGLIFKCEKTPTENLTFTILSQEVTRDA